MKGKDFAITLLILETFISCRAKQIPAAERMKRQFSSTHKIHRSTRQSSSFKDYNLLEFHDGKEKGNWLMEEDVFNDLKVL